VISITPKLEAKRGGPAQPPKRYPRLPKWHWDEPPAIREFACGTLAPIPDRDTDDRKKTASRAAENVGGRRN